MSTGRLKLKVVTPARVVIDTEADAVTLPAALGMIGILPGHSPLLASLRIGEMEYRTGAREHYLVVENGFVEVAGDVVNVLADNVELPVEIDLEAATASKIAAEEAMKTSAGAEQDRQRAIVAGAVARITVASRH